MGVCDKNDQKYILGFLSPHHGDWEAHRRRERKPKADFKCVDDLGAFRPVSSIRKEAEGRIVGLID